MQAIIAVTVSVAAFLVTAEVIEEVQLKSKEKKFVFCFWREMGGGKGAKATTDWNFTIVGPRSA